MLSPIIISLCFAGLLVAVVMVLRARERRRKREHHTRRVQRRAHQWAWDVVMRRTRHQRLTDQRHLTD